MLQTEGLKFQSFLNTILFEESEEEAIVTRIKEDYCKYNKEYKKYSFVCHRAPGTLICSRVDILENNSSTSSIQCVCKNYN